MQEPWDQNWFKELLAKWVAACDQPFSAVDEPEFRKLLEYTHHPAKKPLTIPRMQSVKGRIMAMGTDMIEDLKAIFKVRYLNLAGNTFSLE